MDNDIRNLTQDEAKDIGDGIILAGKVLAGLGAAVVAVVKIIGLISKGKPGGE